MRKLMMLAGSAALSTVFLAASAPSAEACSLRGRYCSYPYWAANAFEGRHGRGPFVSAEAIVLSGYYGRSYHRRHYYGSPYHYYGRRYYSRPYYGRRHYYGGPYYRSYGYRPGFGIYLSIGPRRWW